MLTRSFLLALATIAASIALIAACGGTTITPDPATGAPSSSSSGASGTSGTSGTGGTSGTSGTTGTDAAGAADPSRQPGSGAQFSGGGETCCAKGTGKACCENAKPQTCFEFSGDCSEAGQGFSPKSICQRCCAGLVPTEKSSIEKDGACSEVPPDDLICAPCGDGVCQPELGENKCNCAKDCP